MYDKLARRAYSFFEPDRFADKKEFNLYLLLFVANFFCGIMHVCLLAFFISIKMNQLIFLNVISVLVYISNLYIVLKRKYSISGIVVSIEIIFYTTAHIIILGARNYILLYYLCVMAFQIIIPYARIPTRVVMCVITWALIFISSITEFYYQPWYYLMGNMESVMSVLNINIVVITLIIEMTIESIIKHIVQSMDDIKMEKLRYEAYIDSLTSLYNRRYAEQLFEKISEEKSTEYSMAMLDIDDFKGVNDTYGHNVGDIVLKKLAQTLTETLRKTDTVIRWGGEEFLILLNNTNTENAKIVLEKLRREISEMQINTMDYKDIKITVSMGISKLDKHNIEKSIEKCDKNLYIGKKSGKNRVVG